MSKTPVLFVLLSTVIALAIASARVEGADACKRTTFETKLVADACKTGGTAGAKDAMKKWVKEAKSKQSGLECATCHSKMAPTYDLKPDGAATFKRLGGQ
ncbi:hypothetical protein BH11MYX3_BH11MYX3_38640 [soil metagenome]